MRIVALTAAALLLATAAAHAQQADRRFNRADTNHDGRVTLQEYETYAASRLMKAKGPHAQKFRSLDAEQQASVLQRRFQKLDRDHKGYLEPGDFPRRRQG